MLCDLIRHKRNQWYSRLGPTHAVRSLIRTIEKKGNMSPQVVEALKIYWYLICKGNNRSLRQMFRQGCFNSRPLLSGRLSQKAQSTLRASPFARAFYEYFLSPDSDGVPQSPEAAGILTAPGQRIRADALLEHVFRCHFYADYVFSFASEEEKMDWLAAVMYWELYFSLSDGRYWSTSHNFLILERAGKRNRMTEVRKYLETFEPTRVIENPAATWLTQSLYFVTLKKESLRKNWWSVRSENALKVSTGMQQSPQLGRAMIFVADVQVLLSRGQDPQGLREFRKTLGNLPSLTVVMDDLPSEGKTMEELSDLIETWNAEKVSEASAEERTIRVIGLTLKPRLAKPKRAEVSPNVFVKTETVPNLVY